MVKRRLAGDVVVVVAADDVGGRAGPAPLGTRLDAEVAVGGGGAVEGVARGLVRGVVSPPEVGPVAGPPPEPGVVPWARPASTATGARCEPEECSTRATAPRARSTATTRDQVPRARPAPPGRAWLGAGAVAAGGVVRASGVGRARPDGRVRPSDRVVVPTVQLTWMRLRPPGPSFTASMKPHFAPGRHATFSNGLPPGASQRSW